MQSVAHTLLIRVTAGETISWGKLYVHGDLKASCEVLHYEDAIRVFVMVMATKQA